ncbi:MAG TPA: YfiR family protein, partial [Terriglobia bacterium]|nr:YfiR family protein [Terriglobia bacterium]
AVHGLPILTVGEHHRFGHIGGMVYFTMKNYHINIVINTDVTEKAGLKVSAKLMSVAKPFKEDEGGT